MSISVGESVEGLEGWPSASREAGMSEGSVGGIVSGKWAKIEKEVAKVERM